MERDYLKKFIAENKQAFEDEAMPDFSFEQVQKKIQKAKKKVIFLPYRPYVAAAVLLIIASIAFLFLRPQNDHFEANQLAEQHIDQRIREQQLLDAPKESIPTNIDKEMMETVVYNTPKPSVKRNKVDDLLVGLEDPSSSTRLMAVLKLGEQYDLNTKQVQALSKRLLLDENSNVRLASLEILSEYTHYKEVQYAMISSLVDQRDPIVQMEIIHMTERLNDPEINSLYTSLVMNEETSKPVQEAAYFALASNKLR